MNAIYSASLRIVYIWGTVNCYISSHSFLSNVFWLLIVILDKKAAFGKQNFTLKYLLSLHIM